RGPLLRHLLRENRGVTDMREPLENSSDERTSLFEAEAMAAEALLVSPRWNLPSPLQRLMNPLRRVVLRVIRVYWVQQLGVDRALLAAMRTLRRESRSETESHAALLEQQRAAQARMREELSELADGVRALNKRVDAMTPSTEAPSANDPDHFDETNSPHQ